MTFKSFNAVTKYRW